MSDKDALRANEFAELPGLPTSVRRLLSNRAFAILLAVAIAVIGTLPQFLSRLNGDAAFLLYAAGRVLDGARLYVDLVEINPPLIVWLNLPIQLASRITDVTPMMMLRLCLVSVLVGSLFASRWVLRRTDCGNDVVWRRLVLLLLAFALFVLPRLDWGEREHVAMALLVPYVLLAAPRLERQGVSRFAAIAIGAMGALGMALKPPLALLWFAREGLVLRKAGGRKLMPEAVTILAGGAAYILAVKAITPEYFGVVRQLGRPYGTFIHNSLGVTALLGDGAAVVLGAVLLAVALWRWVGKHQFLAALLAAIVALYLAAVIQLKGFRYHFLPSMGLSWVLLGLLASRAPRSWRQWTGRLFASIAASATITMAMTALIGCIRQAGDPLNPRYDSDPSVGQLIQVAKRFAGEPVAVISTNMASGFPLTNYAGTIWPLRFTHLWPLVAVYDSALNAADPFRYRPADRMVPLERMVLVTTSEDLLRARPPLIAVLTRGPDLPKWGMRRLDLLAFMRRDDRLRRFLGAYDSAGVVGQYMVFVRRDAVPPHFVLPPTSAVVARATPSPNEIAPAPDALLVSLAFAMILALCWRYYGLEARP